MTIVEKIESAKSNKYLTLFKEGLFYKCYNQNAMVFVSKVKNYKVSLKYIKSVGEYVCSVGFPVSDIEAYFMNMNHKILYEKVIQMLPQNKKSFLGISRDTLIYMITQTIFNSVAENYLIKGSISDWDGLPPSKSLFNYPSNTGLPIGNLTSQVFGNVYMNDFDLFVKKEMKVKYYGRNVDDMLFVHNDKSYLEGIIPQLSNFLLSNFQLKIHPNKIVLKSVNEYERMKNKTYEVCSI